MTRPGAVTYDELLAGILQVVTWVIEDADGDADRWCEVASHIDTLPARDRDRLVGAFETLNVDSLGEHGRNKVWRALLDLSATHRKFATADWAMPGEVVDRIAAAAARFAPTSPVDLSIDLFGHRPHLPGIDSLDYPRYEEALPPARSDAARLVLDQEGVAGLLRLGAAATLPVAVGWAAANARGDNLADDLLPLLGADRSDGLVAHGYAAGRIDAEGLDWLIRQLQRWPDGESLPRQVALLLAVTRPDQALITIVDDLPADVRAAFWQSVNPVFVDPDARPVAARRLIEYGRPWGAMDVLVSMLHALGGPVNPDIRLVESVLTNAATGPSGDSERGLSPSWEIGELLDYLERARSDIRVRARLEFFYAHLLQHTRSARALYEVLGTDPALFAEIMSSVFHAEGQSHDEEVPPERRAIATVGFAVLRNWRVPPGLRPDGTIDAGQLSEWVTQARRLLADSGRSAVGDIAIGEVLAFAPADAEGLWPAEPVRDLIEGLRSPKFELGLQTGKFRGRGMVFRSLDDGGAEERQLAAQCRAWADQVSDRWPYTGALLRRMADDYDRWAHREQDQSEQFRDDGA
jgi:hypothetical protein